LILHGKTGFKNQQDLRLDNQCLISGGQIFLQNSFQQLIMTNYTKLLANRKEVFLQNCSKSKIRFSPFNQTVNPQQKRKSTIEQKIQNAIQSIQSFIQD
jgi:hypothetical protein